MKDPKSIVAAMLQPWQIEVRPKGFLVHNAVGGWLLKDFKQAWSVFAFYRWKFPDGGSALLQLANTKLAEETA